MKVKYNVIQFLFFMSKNSSGGTVALIINLNNLLKYE